MPPPAPTLAESADSAGADAMLGRMQAGDRVAAAEFVTRFGSRIRRRVRGKLSPAMRRIFDSQEILSTVSRRLDIYVKDGRLTAASMEQLWALIFRIADHALIDKARVFRRLQAVEGEDGEFARGFLQRLRAAERRSTSGAEIEIDKAMSLFSDRIDRQILSSWLVGISLADIAVNVGLASTAVRKRWQNIRETLQDRFATEPQQ